MTIAIVDYGLGNLFSVRNACAYVGVDAAITSDPRALSRSSGVILPGVGAFGDAIDALRRRGLVEPLLDFALSGRPMMGVCLGMQLLMSESLEFGRHQGLGLIPGLVARLPDRDPNGKSLRVPNVGWSRIEPPSNREGFRHTPLAQIPAGAAMYFVHSYHCVPEDASVAVATTSHGTHSFVSAVNVGNLFGCQFHPEKSGHDGLRVYREFAAKTGAAIASGRKAA